MNFCKISVKKHKITIRSISKNIYFNFLPWNLANLFDSNRSTWKLNLKNNPKHFPIQESSSRSN